MEINEPLCTCGCGCDLELIEGEQYKCAYCVDGEHQQWARGPIEVA